MAPKTATADVLEALDTQEQPTAFALKEGDEVLDLLPAADEPEVEEPAAPAPAVKTPATVPVATHVAERQRRRGSESRWKRIEEQKQKLEQSFLGGPAVLATPDFNLNLLLSDTERAEIRKKAEAAESFGDVADIVLAEYGPRLQARIKAQVGGTVAQMTKSFNDTVFAMQMNTLDHLARIRNPHYERVINESGLLDAISPVVVNGQTRVKDEVIGKEIFSKRDPAQALYDLACDKLATEGRLDAILGDTQPASDTVEEPADEPAPAAPRAAAPTPVAAAAAARAEVLRTTAANGARPKGISHVPAATPGGRNITRRQIDTLADKNPDGYRKLMAQRPDIREWYLSGGE